jgi:uracil-DNA glycosylase family 4
MELDLKKFGIDTSFLEDEDKIKDTYGTSIISENEFPAVSSDRRLAVVVDWPYPEGSKTPFASSAYGTMRNCVEEAGFSMNQVYIGSVLPAMPPREAFHAWGWKHELVQSGVKRLQQDLAEYNPDFILCLGPVSAELFKPGISMVKRSNLADIESERGAPFYTNFTGKKVPALISFHPTFTWRQFLYRTVLIADLGKAWRLAKDGWKPKEYNVRYLLPLTDALWHLQNLKPDQLLSVDIETYPKFGGHEISCIGFATDTQRGFCINFFAQNGERFYTEQEETIIWKKVAQVLERNPLLGQNAVHFDHEVLMRKAGIVPNFIEDTIYMQWEAYCEMPKSLGFMNSLYTDNEYHKDMLSDARRRKIPWYKEFEYCTLDCCRTLEIYYALKEELKDRPETVIPHYYFTIKTTRPYQYMGYRGVRVDHDKLNDRVSRLKAQAEHDKQELWDIVGREINVNSPQQLKKYLYEELKLPKREKPVKLNDGSTEYRETADYLTVLYFARKFPEHTQLLKIGRLRKLLKRVSALNKWEVRPRSGRLHWAFNLLADTTRSKGYKPNDLYGIQPQNVDRRDRDLVLPDCDFFWLKSDLEGADSWTVAAQLASLGYPRMLEDLQSGLKPAVRLCMARLWGKRFMQVPASELVPLIGKMKKQVKEMALKVGNERTEYDISKMISHGTNYLLSPAGSHLNIFRQSDGELFVLPSECEEWRDELYNAYGLNHLHNQLRHMVNNYGYIDAPAGNRRYFFGRPDDTTLRAALAHLPQNNTGYANNTVISRLYYDQRNRRPQGFPPFILDMLNSVHDEMDLQFHQDDLEKAQEIFWALCDVPIETWGVEFTIPFESAYGPSWGEVENELINPYK